MEIHHKCEISNESRAADSITHVQPSLSVSLTAAKALFSFWYFRQMLSFYTDAARGGKNNTWLNETVIKKNISMFKNILMLATIINYY